MQAWDNVSVRAVLNNRFYLGEMACGKSKRKYVGSKGGIAVPMEFLAGSLKMIASDMSIEAIVWEPSCY